LSYAFFAPATSFPAVQMEEWAKELKERTDGQVEVELFVGGTLLGAGDIYEGVSQGVVDIGLDSPAYDTNRFPLSSVISVPLNVTTSTAASKTFLDILTEYEPEEYDDYQIITAFTTEASHLQSTEPLTNLASLKGKSLRGAGSGVPLLEDLGARPTGMSMAEVSESLNTGIIEGYASSREVLKDFGLAESVKYVTDYPLGISNSFVAVMDKQKFDALPENVQQVILDLREEMMTFASQLHDKAVEVSLEESKNNHGLKTVSVDEGEVSKWDAILEQRAKDWVTEHQDASFDAQDVLDRTRELMTVNTK
jgi:TRAP-type C4-dicarboxylate transport system substrate-binding protein